MKNCPKCGTEVVSYTEIGESDVTEFFCGSEWCDDDLEQTNMCRKMSQFAAGPWQDGEPPKDGECWDGWWECFPFERFTIRWCDHRNEWLLRGSGLGISPPDKHVKINLPSAE